MGIGGSMSIVAGVVEVVTVAVFFSSTVSSSTEFCICRY